MIRLHDMGAGVVDLQKTLVDLGYPLPGSTLPNGSFDGICGVETLMAASKVLQHHGQISDPDPNIVSDVELAFIFALRDLLKKPIPVVPVSKAPTMLVDRRKEALATWDRGQRLWTNVTGICLHQTACMMGERDARYDSIGAHVVVCRSGKVLWMHDFNRLIVHGNGWNARCVGVEIDGLYEGVDGNPATLWNDPSTPYREVGQIPTAEAMESSRQVIRWICSEVADHGGQVKALVAHRQASGNRQNDPGSAIWKAVALPMHAELKLTDGGPGFRLNDSAGGLPIPEAWDPSRRGIKY